MVPAPQGGTELAPRTVSPGIHCPSRSHPEKPQTGVWPVGAPLKTVLITYTHSSTHTQLHRHNQYNSLQAHLATSPIALPLSVPNLSLAGPCSGPPASAQLRALVSGL